MVKQVKGYTTIYESYASKRSELIELHESALANGYDMKAVCLEAEIKNITHAMKTCPR